MSGNTALLIAATAGVTVVIKAAGPVAFGGRPLPRALASVVELLAPALLAALVVTQALANGSELAVGADTAGVALGGVAAVGGASVTLSVGVAAATTALLRVIA